jgi:hypothetical protein
LLPLLGFGLEAGADGFFGGVGVFGLGVVVGVEVVLLWLVFDGVVVAVVGVVVVDPFCDGHDSRTLCAGPGRFSEETGAPGGSWNVSTCPLSSVTVTVQSAAEAFGNAATPDTIRTVPADANATLSFRRVNKVALSPPAMPSAATVLPPSRRRTPGPSY